MDKVLNHIRNLRAEAESLLKNGNRHDGDDEAHCGVEKSIDCSNCGGDRWVLKLRQKAGFWRSKPLVVLSLFDGIGGVWAALENLGIPFIGYSCEVNADAMKVTQRNYCSVRHLGDIHRLKKADIKEKIDLVVGGFPCQDLSSMGARLGLHGSRSRLFFEMLRVIKTFSPTWFLAENVASMSWVDREEISKHLSTTPLEIDSQNFSPCKRRRLYWSNIPYPKTCPRIGDNEATSIQSVVQGGASLAKKNMCVLSSNGLQGATKALMELVYDFRIDKPRYINVVEVEQMMGYPPHYTNVKFDDQKPKAKIQRRRETEIKEGGVDRNTRWRLLGNSFSVPVISFLLSPLLDADIRDQTRKYHLPASVREADCSVMSPGEIWAMYNIHQRPNWYVQIVSRSGERFDLNVNERGKKGSRLPLRIECRFLELTKPYEAGQLDLWSTIRGCGLYTVSEGIEVQGSWVAFSHQVTSLLKVDHGLIFIYPAKGEVWSVYDSGTESRYLVYVLESSVNTKKAKLRVPGKEGFSARCRLLQKKIELDLYRIIDKELVYTDLGVFSFRAPYHFHGEGDVLKIELSVKDRERGAQIDGLKRKRLSRHFESDDEDFLDMDIGDEFGAMPIAIGNITSEPLANGESKSESILTVVTKRDEERLVQPKEDAIRGHLEPLKLKPAPRRSSRSTAGLRSTPYTP
ncbi:protein MpDNMT3b [Marchantia polymorpha subsp. ruderalis]|nr:hypothetical protein MARPO_0095s0030 [Marchantia polymorpha]BBN11129.1 hypothetical protein Mp_5g09290 [Marchantia polymorpha subsp. ruderalis]|eukprot:PTQ32768.1 hypothetical protein MARPO_0095s0030 [Marchantia polymorpha]